MKKYQKVKAVAKNNPKGSYAAGCPTNVRGSGGTCKKCELTGNI